MSGHIPTRWGSEGQGSSSGSSRADQEYRQQLERRRDEDREQKSSQAEATQLTHKQGAPDHYSNYADTQELYNYERAHTTDALKKNPKTKGYWADPSAPEKTQWLSKARRAGALDGRGKVSLEEHQRDRRITSDDNASAMSTLMQNGVNIQDFAYSRDQPAYSSYLDRGRPHSPPSRGS